MRPVKVYYDPDRQLLFTLKRKSTRHVIISGGSEYYRNAILSLQRFKMPRDRFDRCLEVKRGSSLLYHDGVEFRVANQNFGYQFGEGDGCVFLVDESRRNVRHRINAKKKKLSDEELGNVPQTEIYSDTIETISITPSTTDISDADASWTASGGAFSRD